MLPSRSHLLRHVAVVALAGFIAFPIAMTSNARADWHGGGGGVLARWRRWWLARWRRLGRWLARWRRLGRRLARWWLGRWMVLWRRWHILRLRPAPGLLRATTGLLPSASLLSAARILSASGGLLPATALLPAREWWRWLTPQRLPTVAFLLIAVTQVVAVEPAPLPAPIRLALARRKSVKGPPAIDRQADPGDE